MAASITTTTTNENFETYSLIWLDASVNNSKENLKAQQKLRACINHLLTFETEQQSLEYIQSISQDDRIILIVSGSLGRNIVPQIVSLRQIIAIYIYCMDVIVNKKWSHSYVKIKGVHNRLDDLIKQIKLDQIQREHSKIEESLPISFSDEQTSTELNGQFIHSQLLIDCLIRMETTTTTNELDELIDFCREYYKDNSDCLEIVDKFQKTYEPANAIWWYSKESFVYRLLNEALRKQNIDIIYLFRFLIRDIGLELDKHRCSSSVSVHRVQYMQKKEIERFRNSIGEYVSMNSFFSTSRKSSEALKFFDHNPPTDSNEKVLFEIIADAQLEHTKAFADIKQFSAHPNEEEVLFMIGSIFRIIDVKQAKNGLWTIEIKLCDINDKNLKVLFQHMKDELGTRKTNLIQFSHVLYRMGKLDHAEKYAQRCLKQLTTNDPKRSACYHVLGAIADDRGDFETSLNWYHRSLQIDESDDANTHNCIAIVHTKQGHSKQALESYEKALKIWTKQYGENDSHVAVCLNNMGQVYQHENNYSKALEYHEKALNILKERLPENHADLGGLYNNIGAIHQCLNNHNQALDDFNRAYRIFTKSLPPNHPDLAMTMMNIGNSYEAKGDFRQAYSYMSKAMEILHQSLSSTSPEMIQLNESIKRLSLKAK